MRVSILSNSQVTQELMTSEITVLSKRVGPKPRRRALILYRHIVFLSTRAEKFLSEDNKNVAGILRYEANVFRWMLKELLEKHPEAMSYKPEIEESLPIDEQLESKEASFQIPSIEKVTSEKDPAYTPVFHIPSPMFNTICILAKQEGKTPKDFVMDALSERLGDAAHISTRKESNSPDSPYPVSIKRRLVDIARNVAMRAGTTLEALMDEATQDIIEKYKKPKRLKPSSYLILLKEEAEGGFSVSAPDIDGCFTRGDTLIEAISNARDTIGTFLDEFEERGIPDPIPSTQTYHVRIV